MAMIGSTDDHLTMARSNSAPRSGKPARSISLRRILGLTTAALAGAGLLLLGIGYARFAGMIDAREPASKSTPPSTSPGAPNTVPRNSARGAVIS